MAEHADLHLMYETGNARADGPLRALVAACEATFSGRVRCYLLSGSFAEGDAILESDLDLAVLFRGRVSEEERTQLHMLAHDIEIAQGAIAALRLDVVAVDEERTLTNASTGLSVAQLVYGEDVRGELTLEPLEQALARQLSAATFYVWQMRAKHQGLVWPLDYPDPSGEFYGYERYGYFNGDDAPEMYTPGVRTILNCATMIATARMTYAGLRVPSKRYCIEMYAEFAPGASAEWLTQLYAVCKSRWRYHIPDAPAERAQFRSLCAPMLEFENAFLDFARPLNEAAIAQRDDYGWPRAQDRLRWIGYP